VKQLSGGALELDLKQPGDGTQPQEILDRVSRGSVDAGFSTASFWAAKIPAAALFAGFPFGPDAKGYVEWFFAGNGRTLYQEMYDQADMNVHVIPCAFGGGEASGWFVKEIRKPEDIKGLRLRGFGLGGRVMSRLGAATVLVPGGKLGEAFDKHEIDGAEFLTLRSISASGFRITPRSSMPGWHQPETLLELLINQDKWNALNDEEQTVLETACRAMLLTTLAESPRLQAAALAELAKQGVRVETWSDELARAFRKAWDQVAREESNRDPLFKKVLDDLDKFRAGPEASVPSLPPMPPAP
jgi:TRAP-type mannitol/chloroaromatic compound transport system substrate-binding protein